MRAKEALSFAESIREVLEFLGKLLSESAEFRNVKRAHVNKKCDLDIKLIEAEIFIQVFTVNLYEEKDFPH